MVVGADGRTDGQTDRQTDGRTDTQNFGGYNIIPRHFLVAGHNKMTCAQRGLGSGWASAQSDQSLRCPHSQSLATR